MEDQLLRAHDLGTVEAENKFAFWIRQRYSRMYYQFKPESVGWIVVILMRKFMIVVIGGLLRHNPAFQLSVMMLVLFTNYILHMKNRPYMSTVERLLVIEEHKALAEEGDRVHIQIAAHIKQATDDRNAKRRRKNAGHSSGASLGSAMEFINREDRDKGPSSYFFNYNTMEAILLSCAILTCLCGVMFVSGELYVPGNEFLLIVATFFLTAIVLGSMVYIGVVFASELHIKVPDWLMRCFADTKSALDKKKEQNGEYGDDDGDVELNNNPLMKSAEEKKRLAAAEAIADVHKEAAMMHAQKAQELEIQQDQMMTNMRKLKKNASGGGSASARRRPKKGKKGKVKEMAAVQAPRGSMDEGISEFDPAAEIELTTMLSDLQETVESKDSQRSSTNSSSKKGSKSKKTKKKGRQNKASGNASKAKHIEANIKHGKKESFYNRLSFPDIIYLLLIYEFLTR